MTNLLQPLLITAAVAFSVWGAGEYVGGLHDKIDALNTTIGNREAALRTSEASVTSLKQKVAEQNSSIDRMAEEYRVATEKAKRDLADARQRAAKAQARVAALEEITTPLVNLDGMTSEEVVIEIGACRRAVAINNAYTSQGDEL